jgi:uncharacterized protein DUF5818
MRLLIVILGLWLAIAATAQTSSPQDQTGAQNKSQEQPPSTAPGASASQTEINAKHLSGERTVVGCVVQSGDGYVLKTEDETFPINSDRDVTPYIGKKVRIEGTWEATGITTTAPVQGSSSSKPDKPSPTSGTQSGPAFGGELRLRIIGTVIGECSEAEK